MLVSSDPCAVLKLSDISWGYSCNSGMEMNFNVYWSTFCSVVMSPNTHWGKSLVCVYVYIYIYLMYDCLTYKSAS